MAHVQTTISNDADPVFLAMGIYQEEGLSDLLNIFGQQEKWMYVISDSIRCRKGIEGVLHIKLNGNENRTDVLDRIISAGKASLIFTDTLAILNDLERERIKQLCYRFDVTIVQVTRPVSSENLIYGPW